MTVPQGADGSGRRFYRSSMEVATKTIPFYFGQFYSGRARATRFHILSPTERGEIRLNTSFLKPLPRVNAVQQSLCRPAPSRRQTEYAPNGRWASDCPVLVSCRNGLRAYALRGQSCRSTSVCNTWAILRQEALPAFHFHYKCQPSSLQMPMTNDSIELHPQYRTDLNKGKWRVLRSPRTFDVRTACAFWQGKARCVRGKKRRSGA